MFFVIQSGRQLSVSSNALGISCQRQRSHHILAPLEPQGAPQRVRGPRRPLVSCIPWLDGTTSPNPTAMEIE